MMSFQMSFQMRTAILILFSLEAAFGQIPHNTSDKYLGPQDFTTAQRTQPMRTVTGVLSGACTTGEFAFRLDGAAAGDYLYGCPSSTWICLSCVNLPPTMSTFGVTVDGGGSVITTGQKGYAIVPYACTIAGFSVAADQPGSISIEIDKKASAIPAATTDSIVASAPVTVASAQTKFGSCSASDCTGWTKAVSANDVIGFTVLSASTMTRATLVVNCQR